MTKFWRRGEPQVWLAGASLSTILIIMIVLITVIIINGMGVFWPSKITRLELDDGSVALGEVLQREEQPDSDAKRMRVKVGNRDLYGLDFRWIDENRIGKRSHPETALVLERAEYGNFYGYISAVTTPKGSTAGGADHEVLMQAYASAEDAVVAVQAKAKTIAARIAKINQATERLRLKAARLRYRGTSESHPEMERIARETQRFKGSFARELEAQTELNNALHLYTATFVDASGTAVHLPIAHIIRMYFPNAMTIPQKVGHYVAKIGEVLTDEPREANTEGGLFPAIYGTVMLVFIMSIMSFPFGVLAGIYLREYAKEGLLLRTVRIAVNNLAGIPSIVFGVFGLGFFIYGIGGSIDRVFFPERLPTPTFGTGGILWASLTLGLLTVPVVIVATEEALGAVPRGVREASLSLGATKFQTLVRVLLPMSSPGILTGFILAMARAAGEVAPLMITGVVKLAPSLPLDGNYPYLHLERKFMHLGFHIYDIGFQSPNVEAAKPMVFVTTLLLVLIVLVMSSFAIHLRNKMHKRYSMKGV